MAERKMFNSAITILFSVVVGLVCSECPDKWTVFQGSCYLFGHGSHLKYVEAEKFCRQHGGYLVHVDNVMENSFLKEYLRSFKGKKRR